MKRLFILSLLAVSTLTTQIWAEESSFFASEKALVVDIKPYDSEESKAYLSKDLLDRKIQPFEISITNSTPNEFYFPEEAINLPLISPKKVASKIFKESIPRGIFLRIASLFFWPLAIPSTIDSIYTLKNHRSMSRDFSAKALKPEDMIQKYSTLHRIVFVRSGDYTGPFTINLVNQKTQEVLSFQERAAADVLDVQEEASEALTCQLEESEETIG